MIAGIVDTTVIIHLLRRESTALVWLSELNDPLGVTSITWLEVMKGENSKQRQADAIALMQAFQLVYLEHDDQLWAMAGIQKDSGMGIADCLIAAVAYRLNVPLFTHNLVDMRRVLPRWRVLQPYKIP